MGYFNPSMEKDGPINADSLNRFLSQNTYRKFVEIKAGDYVFINSGSSTSGSNHGFLVAGWGPVLPCNIALKLTFSPVHPVPQGAIELKVERPTETIPLNWEQSSDILEEWSRSNVNRDGFYAVPYVVDFAGPAPKTNRTQRPIARPFYCSMYHDPDGSSPGGNGFFRNPHNWWFIEIPDRVQLSIENLYLLSSR